MPRKQWRIKRLKAGEGQFSFIDLSELGKKMFSLKKIILIIALISIRAGHAQELALQETCDSEKQKPHLIYRTAESYLFWTYLRQGYLDQNTAENMLLGSEFEICRHLIDSLTQPLDKFVLEHRFLYDYGLDIQDPLNGNTILHYCLKHALPANMSYYNNQDKVFRYYAAQRLFQRLFSRGARLDIPNESGQTVRYLAFSNPEYNFFKTAIMFSEVSGPLSFLAAVSNHFFG